MTLDQVSQVSSQYNILRSHPQQLHYSGDSDVIQKHVDTRTRLFAPGISRFVTATCTWAGAAM
jgi:hypothetical protein